jgi:hypothetical protein
MTPLPRSQRAVRPAERSKSLKSETTAWLARHLLPRTIRVMLASSLSAAVVAPAACVLPPPLEIESLDAGLSAAPVILAAKPLAFPGPIVIQRGDQNTRLSLEIHDPDVNDSLFVRLYVDYGIPGQNNFKSSCSLAASPTSREPLRTVDCSVSTLCNDVPETDTALHFLEAMVSDRQFLESSDPRARTQPLFRAVPEDAGYSFRAWLMQCAMPTR